MSGDSKRWRENTCPQLAARAEDDSRSFFMAPFSGTARIPGGTFFNTLNVVWRGLATGVAVVGGLAAIIGSTPELDWGGGGGVTSVSVPPPVDNPPTYCNAGLDQDVLSGDLVQLDGEGFDAEGFIRYEWTQEEGPTVTLSNDSRPNSTFTAPAVLQEDTELRFRLRCIDGKGQIGANGVDRVSILVNPVPAAPAQVPLDFETLPDGSLPVEFAAVDDDYAEECLRFGSFVADDPSRSPEYRRFVPENTVVWDNDRRFNPPPETGFNITVDFTVPVVSVGADVFVAPGAYAVMTAFDDAGMALGALESAASVACCTTRTDTLELRDVGDIYRVGFETSAPGASPPIIDKLVFERTMACPR